MLVIQFFVYSDEPGETHGENASLLCIAVESRRIDMMADPDQASTCGEMQELIPGNPGIAFDALLQGLAGIQGRSGRIDRYM